MLPPPSLPPSCNPLAPPPHTVLQVESGVSENQLILKTPIDDSYEEEEAGEMVIIINKVCVLCMHACVCVCVCHVYLCMPHVCAHACVYSVNRIHIMILCIPTPSTYKYIQSS